MNGFSNISDNTDYLNKFDVVCLSETWLGKPILSHLVGFKSFNIFSENAVKTHVPGRASGGLMILIKNTFDAKILLSRAEYIFMLISFNNSTFVICSVHFKPTCDLKSILKLLQIT